MKVPQGIYRIESLAGHHDRATFTCGVEALDRYLRQQAGQDARQRAASVYLAVHIPTGTVAGYFTLSSASVELVALPSSLARSLPKYSSLPAILLGRLAVSQQHRGLGLGEHLLLEALSQSLKSSRSVASLAVIVGAKDEAARAFYARYGFIPLPAVPLRLVLPMETIQGLFKEPS